MPLPNRDEIKARFAEVITNPCSRCGHNAFSLEETAIFHNIIRPAKESGFGGFGPFTQQICDNCGYIMMHSLRHLGFDIADSDFK